jgi:NAD(P)-dependent dehydrogenase (short-subunit alcohol dehydrogenase family)
MKNPFNLKSKVVIVTGSSRGIGLAAVRLLAHLQCRVIVSSRNQDQCDAVVEKLVAGGCDAMAKACHIGKESQLEDLVAATVDRFGRLDGLVCNAASNPVYGPTAAVVQGAFDLIMRNNVFSAQRLSALAAPHMEEQGGGSIVLVSSIAGLTGSRYIGTYAVSKAAEIQLARNLALELGGSGIRVNAVAPGLIETDFSSALMQNKAMVGRIENHSALRRVGEPGDIAGVIAFLLSDASQYISGQTLVADGGTLIADPL